VATRILRNPAISHGAMRLYVLLATYVDVGSGRARETYVSQQRLADEMGVTVRSVHRWATELAEHGVLRVEQRESAPGQYDTNRYTLLDTDS
jgi:hypothetical protein